MEALPTQHEIWESIQNLSPDSISGLDGFIVHWDVIQNDIVAMVKGFFLRDRLHKDVKETLLISNSESGDPLWIWGLSTY